MSIEIITFEAPEKANPFFEDVEKLLEASKVNENAAGVIVVPVEEAYKSQLLFQKAANAIGKTARLRLTDKEEVTEVLVEGEKVERGNVRLVFTLTERHKNRRLGKTNKPAEEKA